MALSLVSFSIRELTFWTTRSERKGPIALREFDKEQSKQARVDQEARNALLLKYRLHAEMQPKTLGRLIAAYPYRLTNQHMTKDHGDGRKLGDKTIRELKEKVRKLGLTPDHWVALAQPSKILEGMTNKQKMLELPLHVAFRCNQYKICTFLKCHQDEVAEKTLDDLLQINPLEIDEHREFFRHRYFRDHRTSFMALKQLLVSKGFTVRDGKFFLWRPEMTAMKKAQELLMGYTLTRTERARFAEIIVARRWVT